MYLRMIRLHFEEDRLSELIGYLESNNSRFSSLDGLVSVDLATTGSGEAMIAASWESSADYQASSEETESLLAGMHPLLSSTPHGHEGPVVYSYRT